MITVEKNKVTESEVVYDYFVENKRDKEHTGKVSVNKETKDFIVLVQDNSAFTSTYSKVVRRIRNFIAENDYPDADTIAWY